MLLLFSTEHVKKTVGGLAKQTMMQQLFMEERVRSDGGSGLKQIRSIEGGTRPYHSTTYTAHDAAAIHEHSNYDRTPGLGEMIVVLNGVEFRTRHNDYKVKMPSLTTKTYNVLEDIPFPPVPPSVLNLHNVSEQIVEMREYFKAFKTEDHTHRDYRPYFKPVMCYMEGAWTTDTKTLEEPFHSDRHFIDATSWFDLQEKIRFTGASGGKSQIENYSFLPTAVINVTEDGEPVFAQWNYRIVCHPIKTPISPRDLRPIDDLAARMYNRVDLKRYARHKSARFSIAPFDSCDLQTESQSGSYNDTRYLHGRLDDIMYEIPGKDNYPGDITDDKFGEVKYRVDTQNRTVLNAARYHRHYQTVHRDDSGYTVHNRGFSDPFLFVAETTNPRIAKLGVRDCHTQHGREVCHTYEGRYSYAIPLEIIWLTPLQTWNPYDVHFHTRADIPSMHGRNGQMGQDKAYNGSSSKFFYQTPFEFFHGGSVERDPADTAREGVHVLNSRGWVGRFQTSHGSCIYMYMKHQLLNMLSHPIF